ncbi:Ste24 endopeptidase [Ranunculus cassubicifolius]
MEESSATTSDFLFWFTWVCGVVHLFNAVVITKQGDVSHNKELPEPLKGHMKEERLENFERAQCYWSSIGRYKTFREVVHMLAIGFIIFYRLDAWLWEIAGNLLKDHDYSQENEIIHSLAYLALHFLSLESLEFPMALRNFVVKRRHGLIKNPSLSLFFLKQISKATFRSLIRTVKYVGYIFAVQSGGPCVAFYLWTWYLGFTIFDKMILSNWNSEPRPVKKLYNLPAGELRNRIELLAAAASFPLKQVYVVNRSTDINVCVRDWSKSIVLLDTFIEKYEDREVVAAIAHELGRWRSNHKIYSFIAYQVYMLLQSGMILLIRSYSRGVFVSLGFKTQPSVVEMVMYFRGLNALRSQGGLPYNLFNRSFVYKADAYAKELEHIDGLRAYLRKEELKDDYARHIYPPYSALHYSVPTLIERLIEIDRPRQGTVPAIADEEWAYRGCWEFLQSLWNCRDRRRQKTEENREQETEENREPENLPKKKWSKRKRNKMKEKAK